MLTPLLVSLILAAVMTGGHGQSAMSQIIDQEIIIGMPWNNMYDDNTSPAYANLKSKIETSLSSYYSNMTYFDRVSVTGIRSSSQGYVYIGYRILFMVPSGYTYDQNQLLQMMYQLTSTGLTVDGVFYPPAGSGQTCSPSCKNGGTCSSGTCLCTVNYMGPDCSSSVMTSSHMEGQAELKIDWRDSYYDLESFEFFSFNRSLTEVLAGEFSYMPTFTRVLLTKFIPMDMAVRRKRQAVPVFKDVRIHYIVFFNSSLTPQEETMVESTITSIKNDGLVVGQTKYYPITHTGCTNHLECVYGYCSNGNCICNSGFTGKWCETSTTAGTEKEASVNLTMPYNANMEDQSSFDYRVLKNQLTDAIQSRFMGFPYFARAWIKEIRIHHNFRQRRQAPSQVNMRVFEIFYGVAFSQYIAPGDSTDQQIDAAVKDISENGLEIYGVQYYPPGQQMNKRCDHFLTDPSAQQEVLQQCTTSFSAVDKTQLTQTQICQLYHAALGCSKVILLNHGYNCSYVEMDISPFTNILKQSYAISCQEPLPSEGSSVKPLCQDKTLMAVYAMSTMCTQYIQFGSPCRFIGNVSECLANYTLCDMKNITNTLIDNPAVMRTRYNHDFSACPRPTNVVRPGKCPPAVSDAQVSCVTQCRDDSGCSGRQKCCYNGCTDKCMAPEPAGSCTYNSQCANGGTCYNGNCMCANNYTGPNCYSRLYTKNCSSNADCYNGGSCYNSQCMCAGRYTGVDCSSYVGCTYNSECANGGTCYSGYCSCAPSYTGPYCYTRMPNKTNCTYNSQCANGGTCYNGYCMCANNYTGPNCYSRLYRKNCSSSADCYNGGTCYNSQCNCAGRYTGVDCSSYVGCTYNSECANGGTCYSGYCSCAPSYTGPYCYTRMPNKTSCTYNSQCANGGTCYNGYCMCANNYTGPNCYSRLYRKNCSSNADCYNGGSCYNSQCNCAGRYTGVDCSSYVGCTYNSECANGGTCYSGYCSCAPSYTGPYCYTRMPNKTSCTYNSQCANGGTCYNGYCMCANNYTGPNCYSRLYRKNCSSNADCYNGGSCYNSQCNCAGRYTGVDCSSYVGCTYNYECANGGTCYSGYCSCTPSYTGPYCYTRIPDSTICKSNSECANGGTCYGGYCSCAPSYTGPNCYTRMHNATSCTYNSQCANGGTCYSGYCMCANNYTGPNCYSSIYRKNCSSNADCYNGGSCYNSQCNCAGRYTGVDCSSYVGCTYNSECANGGTCYSGYCSCAPSYTGPYCYTRMPNKTSCTYNSQCGNGGTCYNGYCMCPVGYTGQYCHTRYPNTTSCTYNSQCANGGTCYNGYCMCANNYTGPNCYSRLYTKNCSSNADCYNGGSCYNSQCMCAGRYTGVDCSSYVGCTYNSDCANGGTCYSGYCSCAPSYTGPYCYTRMPNTGCMYNYECRNGGSCLQGICWCAEGYNGTYCDAFVSDPFYIKDSVTLELAWRQDFFNPSSFVYMDLKNNLQSLIAQMYAQQFGIESVTVTGFVPGSVIANFTAYFKEDVQYKTFELKKAKEEVENATLSTSTFGIVMFKRTVKKPGNCPQGNVFEANCRQGCVADDDCWAESKCCNNGCGTDCFSPVNVTDACQQSPCMNGGSCHRSFGNSSFYCQCPKYFTGSRCEKSFCDMLPINPCNKYGGVCQPDFDRGQLCECSTAMINNQYVSGFFCDALTYTPVSQMNMCDKVKNMSLVTRAILTGKMNLMGMPNQGEVLRRVLHQYGFPEVIRTECDLSGAIVKSCKFHIDTPETEMCYCTDYMGSKLPHTSEFRNELPTSCPPSGFQCQDATCMNSSCYFASDRSYCACPRGYSGTYCQTYIGHVCDSYPCYHNFSCTATSSGSYKCNCPPEWGPNCETVPYWYCNCGPMEKCIRVEYCHNGPCKRKNKCVSYDYTGPCATNPCSDKGMCVEEENGQYMCECYSGYSGFNCEKNTEVCRMVDAVGICVQGSCIGDIEGGRLCKCPRNARGAFCEVPSSDHSTMTKCEYQAELYNTAWKILKRELMLPNIPNAVAVVRNITQSFMNSSEIPMTKCTASGDYTPQQCARNMYTMSERCYCVNSLGYEIFYNITTLPGQQPCTAPDPTDIAKIICGSPVNMCQNGATCVGEIMDTTPKLCDCTAGYEGILCERRTDSTEPQEEYTLCTFSYDSYKLMKSIMSGEFNMTVMGVRVDKNLLLMTIKQMMMSPNMIAMLTNTNPGMTPFNASMFGDDFAIIKPNCTENGDFEQLQCEYGINSDKRYVCYCYKPDGRPIPGTRTMAPMMPNCKMTCPSMSSCPLSCPNGYRRDMTGCAVCECKETCEGKWCMPGTRCVRGTKGTECKKTYKPGMCPIDWMPDLDGIMKLFKDTFDTCDITCHDDADCEGDKKCCGACGNKCVAPYYAKDCAAKKELMDAHWELHWNLSAAMNNPDNDMMMMANKTYPAVLKSALTWIRNTKKMWRPNCNMRGEYERKQCEYNTKTNMKVNCFCANREGKRINGTDSMEPICEEKPGSCQKNMPMDVPTEDVCRYECESDYDCDGHDKCCMNGCNSFCKKPFNDSMVHPGTNMTDMFGKLCMVMAQMGENFCSHGSKCVGDWEQGELCRCPSGYKGALCEEMMKTGEKPPTLCNKRKDLYKLATEPEYKMAVKNLLASINMKSLIVPKAICMDDGMFEPMQCDHDLMSGASKFCYCVNVTGHRLNGTVVPSPDMPHCQMGECKPQHMYYSSKSEKPMMCNMKYSSCPYGYVCKEVAYGRHTCCVSHYGHHDICKQAPSHGRWCTETSTQEYVTRHYYNMTLQKCMPFKFRGCHGNDNQFPTEDECKERCVKKEKAGTCPDIAPSSSRFICNNDCDSDGKCAGKRKCCRTDCGYKCLHPKIDSDDRKCKVGWEYTHMNSTPIMCNRVQRNCPTGYSCNFAEDDGPSYCCPDEDKPVDICQQTKVVGPCEAAMRRYYYNRKTEQCEPFIYGGCQGNDNNFGSLEACCRRCGSKDSAQCKPGECPVPDKDSVALCAELCRTDSDCQGEARCCSNGCGRTCIIPPKNITCHMKQREAQMKMQSKKDECNFIHMPRCYPDGSWKSQQCIDSLGLCWCVDRHGRKMPDSLVRGQANCLSFIPYDRPAEEDMPNFKSMDICEGEKVHCCNPALCQLHTCRAHPSAVCRINPCGGCGVEFFDHNNKEVDCDDGYSDCALAYNVAKKHMKQMILNKMLAMKKMNPMMTVNVSEVIMSHMRPKYVPDPAVLPPKCGLDPETGMCRAYMPSWFYNHTSNRCEKFIYGGCGGNDNRFETVEECYQECHEEANPCKSSNKCTATQKCTLGVDYHCEFGPCAHWAECSYIFSDPHISGFPVPMCAGNNYVPTQCHHDICWCLYPNGSPVPGSLAKKNGVNCNHDGTFVLHEDKEVTCPNNMSPNVDCINKCLGQTCAGKPNATCVSSLCDPLCEVKFMEGTEMVDCKSDECSVVHADTPEKCKVEYDCPSSTQPKICKDACSSAKCPGNPCAKCVMDPCTCKAKFMDLLTNKTIDKCTTMMHTPCEMDRCQRMMQKHKEKIATGMSSIVLPECTSSGHYLPQQCEEDACWCVDGRGQFKQASIYDTCDRKEVTKVSISFVFKVDFSLVSGDIEGFKDRLIDAMVKLSMIEDAERFISIEVTEGSIKVKVDIEDKEKPENPSPYVNLIGDSLEKNIIDGDMKLDYKGTELVADVEEFERVNRFEGDDKPEPPEKRSPLSLPVIIAIAVGAGIVAALLLSILIYCCCCSRKDSYSSSQGSQAPTEYTPDTKPQPMMMGHANATYGVVTNSHMDNMAYQAGDDMIKVRL